MVRNILVDLIVRSTRGLSAKDSDPPSYDPSKLSYPYFRTSLPVIRHITTESQARSDFLLELCEATL